MSTGGSFSPCAIAKQQPKGEGISFKVSNIVTKLSTNIKKLYVDGKFKTTQHHPLSSSEKSLTHGPRVTVLRPLPRIGKIRSRLNISSPPFREGCRELESQVSRSTRRKRHLNIPAWMHAFCWRNSWPEETL